MTRTRITGRSWLLLATCLGLLLSFTVFGERGLMRIYELKREKQRVEHNINQLTEENTKMRQTIEALRNDRDYIERIARQDLGLLKPDEVVYQFVPVSSR